MQATRSLALFLASAPLLALGSGCAAAAIAAGAGAGIAGTMYVRGDLETELDAAPPEVAQAAESALKDLELPILSAQASELDGLVVATTAQGEKIHIDLESLADERTRVSIRVGTFGDRDVSDLILARIRDNLAA
jgi:hypothetical protein